MMARIVLARMAHLKLAKAQLAHQEDQRMNLEKQLADLEDQHADWHAIEEPRAILKNKIAVLKGQLADQYAMLTCTKNSAELESQIEILECQLGADQYMAEWFYRNVIADLMKERRWQDKTDQDKTDGAAQVHHSETAHTKE
jgi:septal ring factor EnvC (AmiA/AmiB activator)